MSVYCVTEIFLSVLTTIFPGEPELVSFIGTKNNGNGGDNWSYKSCKAPVKSSRPTNRHPTFFTGRMPFLSPNQQCQSTEWQKWLFYTATTFFVHELTFTEPLWRGKEELLILYHVVQASVWRHATLHSSCLYSPTLTRWHVTSWCMIRQLSLPTQTLSASWPTSQAVLGRTLTIRWCQLMLSCCLSCLISSDVPFCHHRNIHFFHLAVLSVTCESRLSWGLGSHDPLNIYTRVRVCFDPPLPICRILSFKTVVG